MVFRGVRSHYQDNVRVLEIDPVIRHRATTEGSRQTGDCRAVSNSRLVFQVCYSQHPREFRESVTLLVVESGSAEARDSGAAVNRNIAFLLDEGRVAGVLDLSRDHLYGLVPGYLLPFGTVWLSVLDLRQPPRIIGNLEERASL